MTDWHESEAKAECLDLRIKVREQQSSAIVFCAEILKICFDIEQISEAIADALRDKVAKFSEEAKR